MSRPATAARRLALTFPNHGSLYCH
jgi:hypothetical protein